MAELQEKFVNSEAVKSITSAIKAKTDAAYISKDDSTIAKVTDIKINSIKVNGSEVTPNAEKVVDIQVITNEDVNNAITKAIGNIKAFNIEVVQSLPTENIKSNTIYLVPNGTAESQNIYDEYLYITVAGSETPQWEKIGTKTIDLSGYAKTTDLDAYVQKVEGKGLSTNDYTNEEKAKLEGIEAGAQVNTVTSVAGRTGDVTLGISDIADLNSQLDSKVSKTDVLTDAEIQSLVNAAWV